MNYLNFAFLLCFLSTVCVADETPSHLDELRANVISSRRKIRQWEGEIQVRRVVTDSKEKSFQNTTKIWLDGEKLRNDLVVNKAYGIVRSGCMNCYRNGHLSQASNEKIDGQELMPSITSEKYMTSTDTMINPRWFGLVPSFVDVASRFFS